MLPAEPNDSKWLAVVFVMHLGWVPAESARSFFQTAPAAITMGVGMAVHPAALFRREGMGFPPLPHVGVFAITAVPAGLRSWIAAVAQRVYERLVVSHRAKLPRITAPAHNAPYFFRLFAAFAAPLATVLTRELISCLAAWRSLCACRRLP